MKGSRLRENIVALSILQALNYAAPLITVPYLVRVLGPAHFGLLAFAQALVIYFDAITGYGFSLSATRAVACCRDRPAELAATFWRTMYARTALMLASAAILAVLVAAVPRLRATPLLYAATFLNVVGTAAFPVWLFQGLEQMRIITFAQAFARVLSIPALLLLVRHSGDYTGAAVIQGAVPVLGSLLVAPMVWSRLRSKPPRPRLPQILETLREGWHLFVTQMGLVLSTSSTTVVLGFVAGSAAVGYYSAAVKVIRAVSSLLGPVAQALYPHLSNLKAQSLDLTFRMMRKSFAWIAVLALGASLATFLLAAPLGPLVWGRGFAPSILVLRWLSPLPLVFALINIFSTQTMVVFGMDALVSRIVLVGAGVNLVLAAALSVRFGAVGAAAATVTSGTLISLCLAWTVRREFAAWRSPAEVVCAS
jgi:polysaccharide transporter, PST family